MHRNNAPGPLGNRRLSGSQVHQRRGGITVHKDGCGPSPDDANQGGHESVGRQNNFITRPNATSLQPQSDRISATGHANPVGNGTSLSKRTLKRCYSLSQDKVALI